MHAGRPWDSGSEPRTCSATRSRTSRGCASTYESSGMRKAAVLPEPVSAMPEAGEESRCKGSGRKKGFRKGGSPCSGRLLLLLSCLPPHRPPHR